MREIEAKGLVARFQSGIVVVVAARSDLQSLLSSKVFGERKKSVFFHRRMCKIPAVRQVCWTGKITWTRLNFFR